MHPTIVHHDGDGNDAQSHRQQVRRKKRKLSSTVSRGIGGSDEAEVSSSTPKRAKRSHNSGGGGDGNDGVEGHSATGCQDALSHRPSAAGAATTIAAGRSEGTAASESATDRSSAATSSYASSAAADTTTMFRHRRRPPSNSGEESSSLASARIARVLAGPQCRGSRHRDGGGVEESKKNRSIVAVNARVANGHIGRAENGDATHPRSSANGDAVVTPPSEPTPPRIAGRMGNGSKAAPPPPPPEDDDAPSGATTNVSPSTGLVIRGRRDARVANDVGRSRDANLVLPPEDDIDVTNALPVVEGRSKSGVHSGGQHGPASESTTIVPATQRTPCAKPPRRRGLCRTVLLLCGLLVLSIAVPLATLAVLAGRDVVRTRGREEEQLRFELLEARQELDGLASAHRDDSVRLAEARRRIDEALGSRDDVRRSLGEAWGRVDDLIASNGALSTELVDARAAVGALTAERDALASAREELSLAVSRTFQLELDAVAHGRLVREWTAMRARMEDEIESLRERLERQEEEAVLAIDAVIRAAHSRGGEEISAFEGRCAEEVDRQGQIAADAINAVAMAAATASSTRGGGRGDVGGATANGERKFEEEEAVVTEGNVTVKQ